MNAYAVYCHLALPEELSALVEARRTCFETRSLAGMRPEPGCFADRWDYQRNTRSYWLRTPNGVTRGTIRVSLFCENFEWQDIPACAHFSTQVETFTNKGGAAQTSLMGVLPDSREGSLRQTFSLLRAGILAAHIHAIRHFIAIVDAQNSKLDLWHRLGLTKHTSPVSHPIAQKGAVLIVGLVEDMILLAQKNRRFLSLVDFPDKPPLDQGFPVIA